MTPPLRSIWDEVCARVRAEEDPRLTNPWLDRIAFVAATDDTVILATENRLYLEYIQDNLEPVLVQRLRDATERPWRISYQFDSSLDPVARGPARANGHGGSFAGSNGHGAGNASAPGGSRPPADASGAAILAAAAQVPDLVIPPSESGRYRLNPKHRFESFIVGSGTQFAVAACQNVAEQPARNYNPLFLFGGVGLGKTHLLNAIGHQMLDRNPGFRVLYVPAEEFVNEMVNSLRFRRMDEFRDKFRLRCDALLVDDIQFLAGKTQTQEEFFHTFNALHGSGRQIAVTADRYPKDIDGLEDRLRSRFDWGLVADVQPPDTETKVAILKKKSDDENIRLPDDVAFFVARHAGSNIRELEGTLNRLIAMGKFHGAPISLDFARKCLDGFLQVPEPGASLDVIVNGVARFFNVKVAEIKGPRRTRQLVVPRQVAMYLARKHTGLSLPELGKRFGGRDHTTVLHALRKVEHDAEHDPSFRGRLDAVARSLALPLDN